jgi:hypothetical protein
MNVLRAIFVSACFSILAIVPALAQKQAPRLSDTEVVRIANAYASRMADFQQFEIRCLLGNARPGEWNVLYVRKGPGTPDHFSIRVSEKTKRATLVVEP